MQTDSHFNEPNTENTNTSHKNNSKAATEIQLSQDNPRLLRSTAHSYETMQSQRHWFSVAK